MTCEDGPLGSFTEAAIEGYVAHARASGSGRPRKVLNRYEDGQGYVHLRVPPDGKFVLEHRVVMMALLGRPLIKGESVHHKNGQRNDNAPGNLELWVGPIRKGARAAELRCPHCDQLWLAPPPEELVVSLEEVAAKLSAGEWTIPGGTWDPDLGKCKPLQKVLVTLRGPLSHRTRRGPLEGQERLVPVMSA